MMGGTPKMQTKTTATGLTDLTAGLYKHVKCALPSQINRDKRKKKRETLTEGAASYPIPANINSSILGPLRSPSPPMTTDEAHTPLDHITSEPWASSANYYRIDEP